MRVGREQGWISLFRGNFPSILSKNAKLVPTFYLKDFFKSLRIYNPKTEPTKFYLNNIAVGGVAGGTTLLFAYPLDVARLRLATDVGTKDNRAFKGMTDCYKKMLSVDGIAALYRGFSLSFGGIVVYRGLYFGLFDGGKALLFPNPRQANILALWAFA